MTVISHSENSGCNSALVTSAFQCRSYLRGTVTAVRAPRACVTPEQTLIAVLQRKGKDWNSNIILLSSCSEDMVLTNSPQKARSCKLLLRRGWEAGFWVPISQHVKRGQESVRNPTEGVPSNVWKTSNCLPLCAEENLNSNRRLCQHSAVSLARGLHTPVDTSHLSYRCCTTFRTEPLTIQLFEHMCIFHSTNRKNMGAGLQRLDPRARMRVAEKVFLWEISVVSPVVSLFLILFAHCSTLGPWGR